jgi:hypothetical protein
MKYENIQPGNFCRICYNRSADRNWRWETGMLPEPGTIVKVLKKDRRDYTYPIRIETYDKDITVHYTCHPSDLRKLYYIPDTLDTLGGECY